MAYSKGMHERARAEIKKRKSNAENESAKRKWELAAKSSEYQMIEAELAKTGFDTVMAFSLSKEEAEIKLRSIRERNTKLRQVRAELLKSLNLPGDYLDIKYTCPKCEDTGICEEYDSVKGVSYGSKYCDCYMALLKQYAIDDMLRTTPMELSSFEDFNLNYYSKKEVNGECPYNAMKGIYLSCQEYVKDFDTYSNSLYFYGRTGLGKTHLSLAIADAVIKKGYSVIYGSVITFLNKMEKEKFGRGDANIDTESLLIDVDLLILDDLGAEFSTSFTFSALYNIINSRIARGVPTIISSNLNIEELKQRYPESIASRIIGNYQTICFIGDDIRQKKNDE